MKILFLTKYNELGPSSRYRVYQYLDIYKKAEIEVAVSPLFESIFFSENKKIKIVFTLYYYFKRFFKLFQIYKYDFVYIEYELFPYFPSIFEKLFKILNAKYIVDYDDAIFHNYDVSNFFLVRYLFSNKIKNVIKNATYVITGSPYLTSYANTYNSAVSEIPTSISSKHYTSTTFKDSKKSFIIGWIGSKTTSVNVVKLIPVFQELSKKINFQLNLIGFDENEKEKFKSLHVNFIKWNTTTEIEEIKKMDVGIMPLDKTPFNQGKCGFKLVQYMGCALPTISSPLEANIKINRNKKNLHATTNEEWLKAFLEIYNHQLYYKEVGILNYQDYIKHYTIENNSKFYLEIFNKVKWT